LDHPGPDSGIVVTNPDLAAVRARYAAVPPSQTI